MTLKTFYIQPIIKSGHFTYLKDGSALATFQGNFTHKLKIWIALKPFWSFEKYSWIYACAFSMTLEVTSVH